MTRILYYFVNKIALIHDKLLEINDRSEFFLSDKQLHFVVMGLFGIILLMFIYPLFIALSKKHVLTIAWLYVFTIMVVLSFAIEIGQGYTGTGNMEMEDVVIGLIGFMFFFLIFEVIRRLFRLIRHLLHLGG